MSDDKVEATMPDVDSVEEPTNEVKVAHLEAEYKEFEKVQQVVGSKGWDSIRAVFKYWLQQRAMAVFDAKSWDEYVQAKAVYGFIEFDLLNLKANIQDRLDSITEEIGDLLEVPVDDHMNEDG